MCVCFVSRSDVTTLTPWLAPIVWEGTFDLSVIDSIYSQKNITVATTVFALGKYVINYHTQCIVGNNVNLSEAKVVIALPQNCVQYFIHCNICHCVF